MKITVAVDNTVPTNAKRPFRGEHGLSLLLEASDGLFLFDAGQSDLLIHNLSLLGIRPADLTAIIVSHGHYDHTGGLTAVLTHAKKKLPVYIHRDAFIPRFSQSADQQRFIGIPYSKDLLAQLGADFQYIDKPFRLTSDLWLSGPIPRQCSFETSNQQFVLQDEQNCLCQDHVQDDMAIYHTSVKGLTVISGCAHAGIINTIEHGLSVTQEKKLRGIVGGTHLGPATNEQQMGTLEQLQRYNPECIAPNHCTGFNVMHTLAHQFPDSFVPAFVGVTIDL